MWNLRQFHFEEKKNRKTPLQVTKLDPYRHLKYLTDATDEEANIVFQNQKKQPLKLRRALNLHWHVLRFDWQLKK